MEKAEVITRAQCETTLKNFTQATNVFFKYSSVEPLKGCSGFIGQQYTIKLYYQDGEEEKIAQFFLKKIEISNLFTYKISSEIRGCEKENWFYGTLLPLYKSYGINCDFAPEGYLCDKDIIILEDLSLQFFAEVQNKPMDIEQCRVCLEVLARLHTATILFERKRSEELGTKYTLVEEYGDILEEEFCSGKDTEISKYFRYSVLGLCDLVDLIDIDGIDKQEFKVKLKEQLELLFAKKNTFTEFKSTLIHGDVWTSNLLVQNDCTGRIKLCKLIDYQTISYGPLASDVILFIFRNTRKALRDIHYTELLTYYYNCFSTLLERHNIEPSSELPKKDFEDACRTFRPLGKIFGALTYTLNSVPTELYKEDTKTTEMLVKYWHQDRSKFILKYFYELEEYRELMTEEITELASMLFVES